MNILEISKDLYTYLKYIFYILLVITIFTTSKYAPEYLDELNIFIKLFICSFLIYRFNPIFGTDTFEKFDKNIVFDSALYLLSGSLIINAIEIFKKKVNKIIENYQNYIKTNKKKTNKKKLIKKN